MGSILLFSKPGKNMRFVKDTGFKDISEFYKNLPEIQKELESLPIEDRTNCYYTLAPSTWENGKRTQVAPQTVVPFDIDYIDQSKAPEDYIQATCDGLGIEEKVVGAGTGYGVQVIVQPKDPIELKSREDYTSTKDSWKELNKRVEQVLVARGLKGEKTHMDTTVWRVKGLMRVPVSGIINHKPGRPDAVSKFVVNNLGPQSITIARAQDKKAESQKGQAKKTPMSEVPDTIIDSDHVKKECKFLQRALVNPKSLRFDEWFTAATILNRCDHDLEGFTASAQGGASETVNSWDAGEIQRRTDEIRNANTFGVNCETVESKCDTNDCAGCPWQGRVKNPLNLKDINEEFNRAKKRGFWAQNADGSKSVTRADYINLFTELQRQTPTITMQHRKMAYVYEGGVYRVYSDVEVNNFVEETMDPPPETKQVNEFKSKVHRSNMKYGGNPESKNAKDRETWFEISTAGKICVGNGILDIKTRELTAHDSGFGFRSRSPMVYDPTAKMPTIWKYLFDCHNRDGDRDLEAEKTVLMMWADAFFRQPIMNHYVAIHRGQTGANGKSTGFKLAHEFMPVAVMNPGPFVNDPQGFNCQCMDGASMVHFPEINRNFGSTNTAQFWSAINNASEGGMIRGAIKGLQGYQFPNRARVHMDCNDLPPGVDNGGFARRVHILNYDNTISASKMDKNLVAKMVAELPGLLNVLLDVWEEFQDRGYEFVESEYNKTKTREFVLNNKPVEVFFKECVADVGTEPWKPDSEVSEQLKALGLGKPELDELGAVETRVKMIYSRYTTWVEENYGADRKPMPQITFFKKLKPLIPEARWVGRDSSRAGRKKGAVVRGFVVLPSED